MKRIFSIFIVILCCVALNGCTTLRPSDGTASPPPAGSEQSGATDKDAHVKSDMPEKDDKEGESQEPQKSEDAVANHPSELNPLYNKFNEARQARQLRAANEIAGEILARNPNDVRIFNALAIMAIDHGKNELARMFLGKVLTKDPNNSAAINNLGVIELKTDNLRLALVQFKKAIALDSRNKAAHANLGSICLQYRNYQCAATELMAAHDYGDKGTDTLNNLAFALAGVGRYDQAESYYDKAGAKNSSNTTVLLNYAVLLIEHANRPQDGMKVLNKLRFVAHEPGILEKVEYLAKKAEGKNATPKEAPID